MAYFFSKLKEQANSFQSIAKNMMVYENQEQRNEGEEGEEFEEVLDDPTAPTVEKPKAKQGSGSKRGSRNASPGKDNQMTSATTNGDIPPGAITKENFDDFFSQIVSSTQAKQSKPPQVGQTGKNNKPQAQTTILSAAASAIIGQPSQAATTKKETLPPKAPTGGHQGQNDSKKAQPQKNPVKSSFEVEELEERIRAYQGILQENEKTINEFRERVRYLENQMVNLQATEGDGDRRSKGSSTIDRDQESIEELRARHQDEINTLLQALDNERVRSLELERRIRQVEDQNHCLNQDSNQISMDYNAKVRDIETLLDNLVQAQIQQKPPANTSSGGGKGKNKGQQQNQVQAQVQKESLEQLQATLDQIKALLKPVDQQQISIQIDEETLQRLSENNLFLKELNLGLSDKMLSLERTYKDTLDEKFRSVESEKSLWLLEQTQMTEQKFSQLKEQHSIDMEELKKAHTVLEEQMKETLKKVESEQQVGKEKSKSELDKISQELEKSRNELKLSKAEVDKTKKDLLESVQQRLQVCLFQTFDLDMKLLGASIEDSLTQFSNIVKENFKNHSNTQTIEEQNLKALKDIWESAAERIKQLNLTRFTKQAQKDSQQWLSTRLPAAPAQQPGQKKGSHPAFKDSELAKLFGQQLELVFSVHQFVLDLQIQLTESNQKKESINLQLTKLQKDLRDSSQREKELSKFKEQNDNLSQDQKSLKQQIQEVLQDKIGFKLKLEEQREKLEMLVVENANLKDKVGEQENEAKRLRKQVKQVQAQMDMQEDYRSQGEKLTQELKWVESQMKSKEGEQEEQRKTVQNLQRAIQQHQDEYDQLVRLKERESLEDKQLISTLQLQADQMKERVRETTQLQERLAQLDNDLASLQLSLEKSELERKEVSKYAQELLEKFKKEQEQQEYQVDRRIINKFLVNYLNQQSSKEVKTQMLEAMSKILAFSIEEKQQLGLVKRQSLLEGEAETQQSTKGIGEKLINFFLMDEDDD